MTPAWGKIVVRPFVRRGVWLLAAFGACVGEPLELGYNGATLTTTGPIVVDQKGTSVTFTVQSNLSGSETLRDPALELTTGLSLTGSGFAQPGFLITGAGHDATVTLQANPESPPAAGTYSMTITALSGARQLTSDPFDVVVAVVATVTPDPTGSLGVGGHLQEFMGTSFQPADWQYQFFSRSGQADGGYDAGEPTDGESDSAVEGGSSTAVEGGSDSGAQALLTELAPQHILVQLMNGGAIPLRSWSNSPSPNDWKFDELDAIVQPVLSSAQVSGAQVELQIAAIPTPIGSATSSADAGDGPSFATYCEDLVHYYNDPLGFQWGTTTFRSPSGIHIPWWGILSDFNAPPLNMNPSDYVAAYNAVVPGMHAVDPTIQFSAFEFAVYTTSTTGDPTYGLPIFLEDVLATAPVNAVSLHMYGTSEPPTASGALSDQQLFTIVPSVFVPDLTYVVATVAARSNTTQVWVTQNNVNSDAPAQNGQSDDQTQPFSNDPRGTSAFFAAWRPYVFAELGKAGNQGLSHWEFTAGSCAPESTLYCATLAPDSGIDAASLDTDIQNAEVDYASVTPFVSYWVDYWLGRMFPSSAAPTLLQVVSTESKVAGFSGPSVDVLATQSNDSVVVMVVDLAPDPSYPFDGCGLPRTVLVDLSALSGPSSSPPPTFSSASMVSIDGAMGGCEGLAGSPGASGSLDASLGGAAGPSLVSIPVPTTPIFQVTLPGYGVTFLKLTLTP